VTDYGFANNAYGERSPGRYSMLAVLVAEVVLMAIFVYVITEATDSAAPAGLRPWPSA